MKMMLSPGRVVMTMMLSPGRLGVRILGIICTCNAHRHCPINLSPVSLPKHTTKCTPCYKLTRHPPRSEQMISFPMYFTNLGNEALPERHPSPAPKPEQ
ncbi:hypothetical protein F5Y07DRAFT_62591 [Xylaria sp. FL0933]|nr:hypothetical protein F5Y07DRAFT_62591 [Xylaria sp. FL0933]